MKIYISGKMSGLPKEYYESLFEKAEQHIEEYYPEYTEIVNPCKMQVGRLNSHSDGDYWKSCMLADIAKLFDCQAIFMLANWKSSKGARMENAIASELDLSMIFWEDIRGD